MKLKVNREAAADIVKIKKYIREELGNSAAAKRIADKIVKSYKQLKTSPDIGVPLCSKVSFETSPRFIVCGNYLIFYDKNEKENLIEIIRIIHGKRNYTNIIFGHGLGGGDYGENDD